MDDPRDKLYDIPSPLSSPWVRVTWFQKIVSLLGGGYVDAYKLQGNHTTPEMVARFRNDILWAKQDLESRLAQVREADSILREIEAYYEDQNSGV